MFQATKFDALWEYFAFKLLFIKHICNFLKGDLFDMMVLFSLQLDKVVRKWHGVNSAIFLFC